MSFLELDHRPQWRLWTTALLIGIGGSLLVLALVVWMNEYAKAPDRQDSARATLLELASPPPKPPSKPKRKPRRQAEHKRLKPVPTPDLGGAALSGIDFGLPDVGLDFGIDDRLLNTQVDAMSQDAVDTPPQAMATGSFAYPPAAKKKGIQGHVLLSVLVDESGAVVEAQVLESSPPGVFDASALEGIRRWRFSPARHQGKPVKTWVQQKIVFQLG